MNLTVNTYNTLISPYVKIEQDGDSFLVINLVTGLLYFKSDSLFEAWHTARALFHRYEEMEY